jgi:acyl-[acyl-carrier-protein]-phospholipid O-acyltransferase/long-chain-fatty-acid--[acyl-carrier-protein] ligase
MLNKFPYRYSVVYLVIVFFNAFVDLGHKVLIQNAFFQTSDIRTYTIMSGIVNAMILLPYIFLFSPSGFIADKFSKISVLRVTAIVSIPLVVLITLFYYLGLFWLAFAMTFLLAVQSAVNSPAKYGYIKETFGKERIAMMNSYVQTVVIIAILASTFIFSMLFQYLLARHGLDHVSALTKSEVIMSIAPVGFLLILSCSFESMLTFLIPKKESVDPQSTFSVKKYARLRYVSDHVRSVASNRLIFTCIIALSVFWGINQVILANYGAYLKEYIPNATALYAQSSLAVAGIGILFGALYVGRISKNFIETGFIPIAIFGMIIGLFLMPMVTNQIAIILLFFFYGIFSGLLVVPLNALIQFNAPDNKLGKILAGNNFTQNSFMFVFLMGTISLAWFHIDPIVSFRLLLIISIFGAIYAVLRLPQSLARYVIYVLISKLYSIEAIGVKNIPSNGGVLLLGNHTSYLDWAVLQISCPRPIRFVMDKRIYNKRYLHALFKLLNFIPISDNSSKEAIQAIRDALHQGDLVALFPEGFISRNGQLGEFHRGYELAIKDTNAIIVPFFIRGLWGSIASFSTKLYRKSSKAIRRRVTICYGKSLPDTTTANELKSHIFALGLEAWSHYAKSLSTIQAEWLRQAKRMRNRVSVVDSSGKAVTNHQLIASFIAMRKLIKSKIDFTEKRVGVILPPGVVGVLANFAVLALGKVVVNLNYTANKVALEHAISISEIKTIMTSRQFIQKLEKKGFYLAPFIESYRVIYLEDHQNSFKLWKILLNLIEVKLLPFFILKMLYLKKVSPDDTAVIYFSSGSEGLPKGVELSHRNILINGKQTSCVLNLGFGDAVLGCLPLFHAFGLTVTVLMPLIEGIPIVFYPDPTDAVGVGKAVARFGVTVLCSTSTLLNIYSRQPKLHPLMFKTLRFVIAGAEKLSPLTMAQFYQKFGIHILEGYGATETSPVVSCNLPDILIPRLWHIQQSLKPGTVGIPVPGTRIKIVDPATKAQLPVGEKGMILIAGPQVMKGYLAQPKKTSQVLYEEDGLVWYVTYDQGFLDEDGYLSITDRYSRFAKIGGEMISLAAVEIEVQSLLPEGGECVAVSIQDEKKGEKIILLLADVSKSFDYRVEIQKAQLNPLMVPREIYVITEIPKLGSGKKDFTRAKKLAEQFSENSD